VLITAASSLWLAIRFMPKRATANGLQSPAIGTASKTPLVTASSLSPGRIYLNRSNIGSSRYFAGNN